jgi:geranylgeranyl pyrophosphate synthase
MPLMTQTKTESEFPILLDLALEVQQELAFRLERLELPPNLREAIQYSVFNGGKRLRPILTLLSCQAVGTPRNEALPASAAIELIHCFSLVHDDLPAMDDDNLRRGQPTLHIQTSEAMAILAGDAMVSLAFEILSQDKLTEDRRSSLVFELASAMSAMIAGQVYDTLGGFPQGVTDDEKLLLIDRNKTSALIRCACRLGAIRGGADPTQLDALTRYGESIGLMFQIVDDLLDVTQSTEHLGKATGKDHQAGKITYFGLHGLDACREKIASLDRQARKALVPLGDPARSLAELSSYLTTRTR